MMVIERLLRNLQNNNIDYINDARELERAADELAMLVLDRSSTYEEVHKAAERYQEIKEKISKI